MSYWGFTPKVFANCSPGFPTLGLHKDEGVLTPKVLANSIIATF